MSINCSTCLTELEIPYPDSNILHVKHQECCLDLPDWERSDTTHEHAFDRYSFWEDTHFWNDSQMIYDTHVFNMKACTLRFNDINYYCSYDEYAYKMGDGFLYGVIL